MLFYIRKILPINDMRCLPVYIYEDMPPTRIIKTFDQTVNLYEQAGLKAKYFKKLKLEYLKPGDVRALWYFVTKDEKMVDVDKSLPLNRAEEMITWYGEYMNKHILKILPEDEIKTFDVPPLLPCSNEKDLNDILECEKQAYRGRGLPEHLIAKVRMVKRTKKSEEKYLKYSSFFYTDGKIIYVNDSDCKTYQEKYDRLKSVKDWWMLEKLKGM